jgi:hypothetical protein
VDQKRIRPPLLPSGLTAKDHINLFTFSSPIFVSDKNI